MGTKKKNTIDKKRSGSTVSQMDLDQFIIVNELPLELYSKMLGEAGINVDEEETIKILEFLNLLAKITIKEIFSPD